MSTSAFLPMLFVLAYPDYSLAGIFSGNLSNPTEVAQTIINLTVPSGLTIQTYQFGGLGTAVSGGGIDSVIALFFGSNANATLIAFNDDGNCPPATSAPYCGDSTLQFANLDPGSYILTVSANQNTPIGPTLGSGFTGPVGPLDGTSYYVDYQISSSIPEPALWLPAGFGLLLMGGRRRLRLGRATAACALCAFTCAMAADIPVLAGGDFQAALNAAQPGDTITLQAGAAFTGNFVAPVKSGAAWITIRTSSVALQNQAGIRVSPSSSTQMAAVVTTNNAPSLDFAFGSHHYRMIGLEIRPVAGLYPLDLVRIGTFETSLSQVPHDIEIDRCYIHGDPTAGGKRGITLNGAEVTIQNSYLSDFKDTFQETQAIASWNGPGPFHIINNHLEAAGVAVLFGGAPPSIIGVLPSDIEVRRNHFFKPLTWNANDPSFAGVPYLSKFHYEMKFGRRAVVDGNVFENSWHPPVSGRAIVLGVRTEGGAVANATVEDVKITNNILRNLGAGLLIFGRDELSNLTGSLRGVTVQNNIFIDVLESNSLVGFNTAGVLATVHTLAEDVRFLHNTYYGQGRNSFYHTNQLGPGYRVENNLLQHNQQGISWNESFFDIDALNAVAPLGYTFFGNAIQGGFTSRFPAGNFFPSTVNDIGYANLALRDMRLTPSSPYSHAATDGLDIGADAAAVYQATQGVVPGNSGFPLNGSRCVSSLATGTTTFSQSGGTGSVTVAAPTNCTWMTTITAGWLTVTGGFSANGAGTVTYNVPPYSGTVQRATSLIIGGLKVIIKQNP